MEDLGGELRVQRISHGAQGIEVLKGVVWCWARAKAWIGRVNSELLALVPLYLSPNEEVPCSVIHGDTKRRSTVLCDSPREFP